METPRVTRSSTPEGVFILSSPRSGSTLLRVMLAGHSELFSPPELNLLPFCTMAERNRTLGSTANWLMDCDQRVGLNEAIMNLTGMDAEASEAWLQRWVDRNTPVGTMYSILQKMSAPRRVVDKTTLNAAFLSFLEKSKYVSPNARYIHLVRHPYSVIESLLRTYYMGMPSKKSFQEAEALWIVPNRNILSFLSGLDPRRYQRLRYEDLVRNPAPVMRSVCRFLGIGFETALLEPYHGKRMTEGSPGRFQSLGDPNFRNHRGIDRSLGEAWKGIQLPECVSWTVHQLAAEFRYELMARNRKTQSGGGTCHQEAEVTGWNVGIHLRSRGCQ
jgi:hypothetical protein